MARPIMATVAGVLAIIAERRSKFVRTDSSIEPHVEFEALPDSFKRAIHACPKTLCNTFYLYRRHDETFILGKDEAGFLLVKRFLGDQAVADAESVLAAHHLEGCIMKLQEPWPVWKYIKASWRRSVIAAGIVVVGFALHGWSPLVASALWAGAFALTLGHLLLSWWMQRLIRAKFLKAVLALKVA